MNGETAIRGNELMENNHERLNDIENEVARLRHMVERIGREKRRCLVEENSFLTLVVGISLIIIAIGIIGIAVEVLVR